jgi:flagellar FliJ protein
MSTKRSERFKPIQDIAQQREDVAAQSLGRIQRELASHHLKLSELMQYSQDYISRFKEQAVKGMSVIQVQSYQNFISQLEVAITEQKKRISRISEACNSRRQAWTIERQKSQVLEKVMTRYKVQEQQTENRREQRREDEFVANQYWHKNK